MDPTADLVLRSDALVAEVSPFGAELRRLATADGQELQWDGDPAVWSGRAPVLFPIVGELNGGRYRLDGRTYALPRHGFARRSTFAAERTGKGSARFTLDADDATRAVYPFDFRLELAFALDGATLRITALVANRGGRPMPASFGLHPAFRWPLPFGAPRDAHRLRFAEPEPEPIRRLDAHGLVLPDPQPTPVEGREVRLRDALFAPDALIFDRPNSRRVLYGAETGPQLALAFDDFPMLGVWSKPGAGFVCVEPWAGIADPEGFDGDFRDKPGVFEVEAGGERRFALSVALLDAPPQA